MYGLNAVKNALFGSSAPPLFLTAKAEGNVDVSALVESVQLGTHKEVFAACAEEAAIVSSYESKDEAALAAEVAEGAATHKAFVFIKPHAVTDKVKEMLELKFHCVGINVLSEGDIEAERIDKEQLIDTHYGAIAAKAVRLSPSALTVQQKAKDTFGKTFGVAWEDAVSEGKVFNAMDAAKKLGCSTQELGAKWGKLKKDVNLLKFGGGFYCGHVDDIFVINGFYMDMRGEFTKPGTCIHYYEVEWEPAKLSWGDFRGKVLGGTDPKTAHGDSVRNLIYSEWERLGLGACPNTGNNGVHASASPFEALSERANWLGHKLHEDAFGKAMLASGVPYKTLQTWCEDPPVKFEGKKQSIFDLLEDLDAGDCLKKSGEIAKAQ